MDIKDTSPAREKILTLYAELIAGKQWKDIRSEAHMSRQWFDKKRNEYGLPSPAEVKRIKREKERPPKDPREVIIERRKNHCYVTMSEAAKRLGITTGVLAVQHRKGKIKGEKEGIHIFFHLNEVERYQREHRRGSNLFNRYYSVQKIVEMSGKSTATVYADIQKGKLACIRKGSSLFIAPEEYERWIHKKSLSHPQGVPREDIIQAYRQLIEGEEWQNLPLSQKITYKGFDKRRAALHLPSVNKERKKRQKGGED